MFGPMVVLPNDDTILGLVTVSPLEAECQSPDRTSRPMMFDEIMILGEVSRVSEKRSEK